MAVHLGVWLGGISHSSWLVDDPQIPEVVDSLVAEHLVCKATVWETHFLHILWSTVAPSPHWYKRILFWNISYINHAPLRPAIPIQGLHGEPLSKGAISHVVILNVKIGDHSETKTFGIIKMPWDLLLGIDWLQKHNPVINWKTGSINFSCCNSGHLGAPQIAQVPSSLDSHPIDIAMLSACNFFWINDVSHMVSSAWSLLWALYVPLLLTIQALLLVNPLMTLLHPIQSPI